VLARFPGAEIVDVRIHGGDDAAALPVPDGGLPDAEAPDPSELPEPGED
jgi:hypothetical protein